MTGDDWSSLPVRESTRDRFREERPEDPSSADEFLNTLLDQYTGDTGESVDVDAEEIASAIDLPDALSYEDVRAASEAGARAALEDMEGRR